MTFSKFAKEKGFTKEEFLEKKGEIKREAERIAEEKGETPGGMYQEEDFLPEDEFAPFIKKELKEKYGFEFREEGKTYYRR